MITLNDLYSKVKSIDDKSSIFLNSNNPNLEIINFIKFDSKNKNNQNLMWLSKKNFDNLNFPSFGTIIISNDFKNDLDKKVDNFFGIIIFCTNPRFIFKEIIKTFKEIDDHIFIPPDISRVKMGRGNVIENNVYFGNNVSLGHNNVIHSGTIIRDNVIIGSNNTIGGVGFGYEKNENGDWERLEHIGGVLIEDGVEIGNNNCIDKAVLGYTEIKKNSKIDNLIHIAHGVIIGKNCLIIANSMIAGSCIINENTWIAPSTSVLNGINIGRNSMTGVGSVLIKDVGNNQVVAGVPAKKIKDKIG